MSQLFLCKVCCVIQALHAKAAPSERRICPFSCVMPHVAFPSIFFFLHRKKEVSCFLSLICRYDTDEVCDAQCDFLHKVHFHCLVEDCGALFSTVDGAIKHSK